MKRKRQRGGWQAPSTGRPPSGSDVERNEGSSASLGAALADLSRAVGELRAALDPFGAGRDGEAEPLQAALSKMLDQWRSFRARLEAAAAAHGLPIADLPPRQLVARLDELDSARASARQRLEDLAAHLAASSAESRLDRRMRELHQKRDAAVDSLRTAARGGTPPDLGGPRRASQWMTWWWSHDDQNRLLDELEQAGEAFVDFLAAVRRDEWREPAGAPRQASRPGTAPNAGGVGPSAVGPVRSAVEVVREVPDPDASRDEREAGRALPSPDARAALETQETTSAAELASSTLSPPNAPPEQAGTQPRGHEPAGNGEPGAAAEPAPDRPEPVGEVALPPGPDRHGPIPPDELGGRDDLGRDDLGVPDGPGDPDVLGDEEPRGAAVTDPEPDPDRFEAPPDEDTDPATPHSAALHDLPVAAEPVTVPPVLSGSGPGPSPRRGEPSSGAGAADHPAADRVLEGPPAFELAPTVRSFATYRESHWIGLDGQVEDAPWLDRAYATVLRDALERAARDRCFWKLWVFARALTQVGSPDPLGLDDIEAMARLWDSPGRPSAGISAGRAGRLREVSERLEPGDTEPSLRWALVLEALRPDPAPLAEARAGHLVSVAGFRDPDLRAVVAGMLTAHARGIDPIEGLKAALDGEDTPSREELEQRLTEDREALRALVARSYSAAGGKVQRTHCREAWAEFIERVHPWLRPYYPLDAGPVASTKLPSIRGKILAEHERIANRRGAKFQDRGAMDRAAEEIAAAVEAVRVGVDRVLASSSTSRAARRDVVPASAASALRERGELADPLESIAREVVFRVLAPPRGQPKASSLELGLRDLAEHVGLLPFVESTQLAAAFSARSSAHATIPVDALSPSRRVAAALRRPQAPGFSIGSENPAEALRRAAEVAGRTDLLPWLLPLQSDRDKDRYRSQSKEILVQLEDGAGRIRELWATLDALGAPIARDVGTVAGEAQQLTGSITGSAPVHEIPLIVLWLTEVERQAHEACERTIAHLRRTSMSAQPDAHARFERAIATRAYAEAVRLVIDRPLAPGTESPRETDWRSDAELRHPQPADTLARLERSEKEGELLRNWCSGIQAHRTRDRNLITRFVRHCFGPLESRAAVSEDPPFVWSVPSLAIREALSSNNPCFLPQLASFGHVTVIVPDVRATDPRFHLSAANIASAYGGDLVILLAPGVTDKTRAVTLRECQKRKKLSAAVIDDLDLLRLFEARHERRPDPLLGTLEIALEQQPLDEVDPFGAHDGRAVRMEMYVGRRTEATNLVREPRYSRLFSGRKLGKSALLRYVADAADKKLQSGNTLSVVYVPLVGVTDERQVVGEIFYQSEKELGMPRPADGGENADALIAGLMRYIETHPDRSLLFVLDEADSFVEQQIEEYERLHERCLTFRLRTKVEGALDDMGLPRIRFVFAGYRSTNTTGGAWANWGEVLVLNPLDAESAASLVAGPLARLGIDVSAQADSIAHRCCYQPAVLLKFGQTLLRQIAPRRAAAPGETIRVPNEQITGVFRAQPVQDEIKGVVRNNFQGNPVGLIVFNALLLELAAEVPGALVPDLADRIADRLAGIDAEHEWLPRGESSPRAMVKEVLKELVERRLVVEAERDGMRGHQLRFPHLLSALLEWDPEKVIRQKLDELLRGQTKVGFRPGSMIAERDLAEVRTFTTVELAELADCAVIVSSWPDALRFRFGGVIDRLRQSARIIDPVDPASIERELDERPPDQAAPVLIGDLELGAWALRRRATSDRAVLVVGMGRLSSAVQQWWFGRIRGLEFTDPDAFARIERITGGIPRLVHVLDRKLVQDGRGGIEISRELLARSLGEIEGDTAGLLGSELSWSSLGARGRELVRMIAAASEHVDPGDPIGWILQPDEWPTLGIGGAPLGPDDLGPLELLLLSGLLPGYRGPETDWVSSLVGLAESDPIRMHHEALAAAG